jgi:uncharacterized protein YgiM (DUF1202 family)
LLKVIALCLCLVLTPVAVASPDDGDTSPSSRSKPAVQAALQIVRTIIPPPIVATGMPVPRWVSVKAVRVNVRRGPSLDQDVLWTYVKPGVPVEIIAEYDTWRRIRDAEGGTGWVKATRDRLWGVYEGETVE